MMSFVRSRSTTAVEVGLGQNSSLYDGYDSDALLQSRRRRPYI